MKAAALFSKNSYASTVLIPHLYPPTTFERVYFNLMTRFRLSQIGGQFLDFSPATFPATAIRLYSEFRTAQKRNDKSVLNTLLTGPHFEMIRVSQKLHIPLPYTIHSSVTSASIHYASLCSEVLSEADASKFMQLAVVFKCDVEGQSVKQLSVFERRLDVKIKDTWRMASLEDMSS